MELLTLEELELLRDFDTPTICNAIEGFGVRGKTEGFTHPGLRQRVAWGERPMVGYARTGIISAVNPPDPRHWDAMERYYAQYENFPFPQVAVIQDIDTVPVGSLWGDVQATVHRALGCVGAITNGGVRDLKEVEKVGFYLHSREVLVSHAHVHLIESGTVVTVCGMTVRPGDLIHADYHGAIVIPAEIAKKIAGACKRAVEAEDALLNPCRRAIEAGRRVTAAEIMEWRREMVEKRKLISADR